MHYVYRLSDGTFTGQAFRILPADPERIAEHVPPGCGAVEGAFDALSQRVNLETGTVEDYRPPAPADGALGTHVWDAATRRWEVKPTRLARGMLARQERDRLLAACDWTQVADSALSAAVRKAWAGYRTALRAVPEQAGFPDAIVWPARPG